MLAAYVPVGAFPTRLWNLRAHRRLVVEGMVVDATRPTNHFLWNSPQILGGCGLAGADVLADGKSHASKNLTTEGTLMSKTKSKTKSKRTKAQRKLRTMALAIAEPRLRAPRSPLSGPLKAAEDRVLNASAQLPQTAQIYEIMLSWSPWSTMLRQQALIAQAFSSMLKAHQQFAQIWRLPARQAPRPRR
jgi:hypothetical protein